MRHVQSGGDFAVMKQLDFRWHAGLIEPATATVMPEQSRHQLVISEFDNPIFSGHCQLSNSFAFAGFGPCPRALAFARQPTDS